MHAILKWRESVGTHKHQLYSDWSGNNCILLYSHLYLNIEQNLRVVLSGAQQKHPCYQFTTLEITKGLSPFTQTVPEDSALMSVLDNSSLAIFPALLFLHSAYNFISPKKLAIEKTIVRISSRFVPANECVLFVLVK